MAATMAYLLLLTLTLLFLPSHAALNASALTTLHYGADAPWYTERIPLFDSADTTLNAVYYYRWAIFRAHQRDLGTPWGFISTEFLDDVGWQLNDFASLNDAAAFHLGEGRWLRDRRYAQDYLAYMYTYHPESERYGNDRQYTEVVADAAWRAALVDGNLTAAAQHLPAMTAIYDQWAADHFDAAKALYWVEPLADATEYTIASIDASGGLDGFTGGQAFRPSINAYQLANARAIAALAAAAGDTATAATYEARAADLQGNFTASLWNATLQHFIDRFYVDNEYVRYWDFIRGRELVGLTPWAWDAVPDDPMYAAAWAHVLPGGAGALRTPAGLSTVEPSYEYYMRQYRYDGASGKKECQWNGPIWPYQTTSVLTGLGNLLDHYEQDVIGVSDYVDLLRLYAELHYDDNGVLNLVEDYYPNNGSELVHLDRSPHYFHSGFVDLILGGLVGIRPRSDDVLEVNPLVDGSIAWFRVDNVLYHGYTVGVQWDADGSHFGGAVGLQVEVDGVVVNASSTLTRLETSIGAAAPPAVDRPLAKSVQLQTSSPYPVGSASVVGADAEQLHDAIDGRVWFWTDIVNGYDSAVGDGSTSQWFSVDFGAETEISRAEIAFYEGAYAAGTFAVPVSYEVQYQSGSGDWTAVTTSVKDDALANGITNVDWAAVTTQVVRLVFTPAAATQVRLVEFKVF